MINIWSTDWNGKSIEASISEATKCLWVPKHQTVHTQVSVSLTCRLALIHSALMLAYAAVCTCRWLLTLFAVSRHSVNFVLYSSCVVGAKNIEQIHGNLIKNYINFDKLNIPMKALSGVFTLLYHWIYTPCPSERAELRVLRALVVHTLMHRPSGCSGINARAHNGTWVEMSQ